MLGYTFSGEPHQGAILEPAVTAGHHWRAAGCQPTLKRAQDDVTVWPRVLPLRTFVLQSEPADVTQGLNIFQDHLVSREKPSDQ